MNSEPWLQGPRKIPVRRLGILHGFEDRDLFLPGPLGGVDSSRRTGPDRGVFQEKGVSSWFGSKELLGSFQSSIPVVLCLFCLLPAQPPRWTMMNLSFSGVLAICPADLDLAVTAGTGGVSGYRP